MNIFQLFLKRLVIAVSLLALTTLAMPLPAFAQAELPSVDTLCGDNGCALGYVPGNSYSKEELANFIVNISQFLTYIIAALVVLAIVIGGFLFVIDGGSGKRADAGKKIIVNSIIGLILAALSATIVVVVSGVLQGDLLSGF
jgi:Type IV secretion system pilin